MDELERDLRDLVMANVVTLDDVGCAGETPMVFWAFSVVAERLSPALRPRFEWLLGGATPAGRVYAAMLLNLWGLGKSVTRADLGVLTINRSLVVRDWTTLG
jgi:hypothetical protein